MPKKQSGKRSTTRPVFVLYAILYDPGGRAGNARLIIEGPFTTHEDAVGTLTALTKNGRFSVVSTNILMVSSAQFFLETLDKVRAIMK